MRTNSPLCRALGDTTTVRLPGSVDAWWTAFAAVIVDFPHCLVQFSTTRFPVPDRTHRCTSSGSNPSRSRIHSAASDSLSIA